MSVISTCNATTDWTATVGGSLSIDTNDKKEGTGSLKDTVAAPSPPTEYVTQYNPTGSWDWSAKKHILFWLKCDRANTAFTWADLAIYDTLGNYRYWDLSFSAGTWTAIKKLLSTGDGQSGTPPNLALIERIRMGFKAADTTPFYKKIDYLRMTYQKSVAEKIGLKEKTLRGSRIHSNGEDITIIALSSIWETSSSISTTWDEAISIQKDE